MSETENRTWLIRYPDLTFSRPIPESELLKIFTSGEMKPQNEICPARGYWFSLQDVKEMRKHFGNIPMDGLFKKVKEDVTQERIEVTAPLVVPQEIRAALQQSAEKNKVPVAPVAPKTYSTAPEKVQSTPQTPPIIKLVLAILTLAVLILFFVWFG
jgi:hypothetical protein